MKEQREMFTVRRDNRLEYCWAGLRPYDVLRLWNYSRTLLSYYYARERHGARHDGGGDWSVVVGWADDASLLIEIASVTVALDIARWSACANDHPDADNSWCCSPATAPVWPGMH